MEPTPRQILVCGSRYWRDRQAIRQELSRHPRGTVVIHGGCRGADTIAGGVARSLKMKVLEFKVTDRDWEEMGRAAGPIRNTRMIIEGQPHEVIVFHENLGESRGSRDMVRKARQYGVPVTVVTGCYATTQEKREAHEKGRGCCKPTSPPYCPACGSRALSEIHMKIVCDNCHSTIETCCD